MEENVVVVSVWQIATRLVPAAFDGASQAIRGGRVLVPYAIGSVAAFWLVERLAGF